MGTKLPTKVIWLIVCSIISIIVVVTCIAVLVSDSKNQNVENKTNSNCMNGQKVIIISLDGYGVNYLDKEIYNISTPNIDHYFIQDGVSATKGLKVTFPTKTYSSHYSILTGMYPPYHGIVSNSFYDPVLNDTYDIRTHKEDCSGKWL